MRNSFLKGGLGVLALTIAVACVELKENAMYIAPSEEGPKPFCESGEIYTDFLTSEFWVTRDGGCFQVEAGPAYAKEGEAGLNLTWSKVTNGCSWVGMGFGWDNWSGKDLSDVYATGALQFYVRLKSGVRTTLPWAIGIEDYAGAQAWLGMSSNAVQGREISTEWTKIQLPLSEFNWDEQGANPGNIKQLIIEVHGDGECELDEISIAPYDGGYRERAQLTVDNNALVVDGELNDPILKNRPIAFNGNEMYIAAKPGFFMIAGSVADETPMVNEHEAGQIYNGDCVEVAFSTDQGSYTRRIMYRSTDRHFGIRMTNNPEVYDFRKKQVVEGAIVEVIPTEGGYAFEAIIPEPGLSESLLKQDQLLGLEIAVDQGDGPTRENQQRWNNPGTPGFHELPILWGEMIVKHTTNED